MKEFADDDFRFDKNGRKVSKWVENTVGKGEVAHYEQFLHFPQCFTGNFSCTHSVFKRVKTKASLGKGSVKPCVYHAGMYNTQAFTASNPEKKGCSDVQIHFSYQN